MGPAPPPTPAVAVPNPTIPGPDPGPEPDPNAGPDAGAEAGFDPTSSVVARRAGAGDAVATAGVMVVVAPAADGGGEVRRVGYNGGEDGAKRSEGGGGAMRICGVSQSSIRCQQLAMAGRIWWRQPRSW